LRSEEERKKGENYGARLAEPRAECNIGVCSDKAALIENHMTF